MIHAEAHKVGVMNGALALAQFPPLLAVFAVQPPTVPQLPFQRYCLGKWAIGITVSGCDNLNRVLTQGFESPSMLQFTIFFIIQRLTHIFLWFAESCSNILLSEPFRG